MASSCATMAQPKTISSINLLFMYVLLICLGGRIATMAAATGDYENGNEHVGVCYGLLGNNLPSPPEAIQLIRSKGIRKVRLYDPDAGVLNALRNTGIQVNVGVSNDDLKRLAEDLDFAKDWVQRHILAYLPEVDFRYITVGNEVFGTTAEVHAQYVGPAMGHVYDAISSAGLQGKIMVTTAVHMAVMGTSYPPSAGSFSDRAAPFMRPVVKFLVDTGAPLMLNVYPYFTYKGMRQNLPYALFTANSDVVYDGQLRYRNLFDAMVDSVYSALERYGAGQVRIVVSESGWPSGGENDGFSTIENARTYNQNLVRHVAQGTPKRPGTPIETYIFALFNENQKTPQGTENHFGLFYPNMVPVYPIDFS
ncbi:glucan endo-1,3-beta-glucosidase-like [Nymphaea colorata]|nr:glucan endo-1,3-beta-glucosidase-like [Nymphaea colorata]